MYIRKLTLENIRCFGGSHSINTSKSINLIVGNNNSGKSTLLKSIYHLQGYNFSRLDRTIDSTNSQIIIGLDTNKDYYYFNNFPNSAYTTEKVEDVKAIFKLVSSQGRDEVRQSIHMLDKSSSRILEVSFDPYVRLADRNLIYPYFSNRKVKNYSKSIVGTDRDRVDGELTNLYAKIDSLSTSNKKKSILYQEACENILGFYIGTEQDEEGKYAAFSVDDNRSIALTSMGDGVPHILGLITDLCIAEDKVFLIEEPENDIHPKALKALLKLIEEKSISNQFFISTHSNIVVRFLGANQTTKVFQINTEIDVTRPVKIPLSNIIEISSEPRDRLKLLEDLGYDVYDYALWKGWLFLEESSAETIINEILIPNFAKGLQNKLRTFSSNGFDGISEKFKNFSKLFIYSHLDSLYKDRAWVIIDAGDKEKIEVDRLKKHFSDWETNQQFRQLSKYNFEEYYPDKFSGKIREIQGLERISTIDRDKKLSLKKDAKKELLNEVKAWYYKEPDEAIAAFEYSASEVIEILRQIELVLL